MLERLRDYLHERRIARAKADLLAAGTLQARHACAARMRDLIACHRRARQVARMERQKGLA